jgi:c-di-GMP-binding flagellar brake protein YcgR
LNVIDLPLRHLMPATLVLNRAGENERYPTLVLDFEDGHEIAVGVPLDRGMEVYLPRGASVGIEIAHGDALRRFRSTVLRRQDVPAPCLFLAWPAAIERVQRRAHVRVEVLLPARVQLPAVEGAEDATGAEPRELVGTTLNLSAGGARIVLAEPLERELQVGVRIEVPGEVGTLVCEARVASGGTVSAPHAERRYWAGFEFLDMPAAQRKALNRYLFDVQREQLRLGVI